MRGEQIVPVQPLTLPDPAHLPDLEHLAQIPAIAMFVARAREAKPDFVLTSENAVKIVEICQRLDGLPLALELAAGLLPVLPPAALLSRLERRLPLLTRGPRDLPERQRTLRNTIAWSYELLGEGEQKLFRRLSVFTGGFTLEALQEICAFSAPGISSPWQGDDGILLEQLGQLLDKSLVQAQQGVGGEPRFTMLETIHEYAQEQLRASGETAAAQKLHTNYFLRLSVEAEPHMFTPDRDVWMETLDREQANLQAALSWSKADKNAVETGLRLVRALSFYWFLRGSVSEGRAWMDSMLERTDNKNRSFPRGMALHGAGWLAWADGDYQLAFRLAEEGLSIVREAGNKREWGYVAALLGVVRIGQGNSRAARPLLKESGTLFKDLGDLWGEATTLYLLGMADYFSGDRAAARVHYEGGLKIYRELGDAFGLTLLVSALEAAGLPQEDEETARSLYDQSLPLLRASQDKGKLGMILINVGAAWLHNYGDSQQAKMLYKQGLNLWQDMQRIENGLGIVKGLTGMAEVAAAQGRARRAGQLFGAADLLLPSTSMFRDDLNKHLAVAHEQLDAATFKSGWTTGQAMTLQQAVTYALRDDE